MTTDLVLESVGKWCSCWRTVSSIVNISITYLLDAVKSVSRVGICG